MEPQLGIGNISSLKSLGISCSINTHDHTGISRYSKVLDQLLHSVPSLLGKGQPKISETVEQVSRDTKRVSWDPKVREKIFWDSLLYCTQHRRKLCPRGPVYLWPLNSQGSDGKA